MALKEAIAGMAQKVADRLAPEPEQQKPGTQDGNVPPISGEISEHQKKYGPNYEKLKDLAPHIVAALQQLCLEYRLETMYADRYRTRRMQYARLFWEDIQYAGWNNSRNDFDFATGGGTSNWGLEDDGDAGPRYEFVTNWYQGYGLSFCALMSSDVPSLSIYPKSREVIEDISAAKVGYDVADVIERNNDPNKFLTDASLFMWTDGIVGAYVRYVIDGERFGYKTMPVIGTQQQSLDGEPVTVPQQNGEEKIPLGQEVFTLVGGLELSVPFYADDFHDYPYLQWNTEPHKAQLKAAYPHAAKGIEGGGGLDAEQVYERLARLGVKQNIRSSYPGDALAILPTFSRTWMRKWAFKRLNNEKLVAELESLFPEGCYAAFSGFEYCESRNESMDKHWRVKHALPGFGQHRPSVGGCLISPQERYNVLSNLQTETYEYGIPPIYADPQVLDFDALANQVAEPAAHFPARARPGTALADGFFQPDPAKEPATLAATMQELSGPTMQFLCGMFPAVFGGDMEGAGGKTLGGYAIARDQAMGRLGLIWRGMKQFYAEVIKLGLQTFQENRPEDVEVPFPGENDEEKAKWIRLADFKGNIMVECEPDEGLPRLKSQQRAVLERLLQMGANMPPEILKMLMAPRNLGWLKTVMGLSELDDPAEDAQAQQMREIQILLKTPPITFPPQPRQMTNPATGQPGIAMVPAPPQSTVPIDVLLDDHDTHFQTIVDWASSDLGQQARKENPAGFANLTLHAQAHKAQIDQAQQANQQFQLQMAHKPPDPPKPNLPKPPSITWKGEDLPPDAAVQALAQDGIQTTADELQQKNDEKRQDKADELNAKLAAKPAATGA
jgi:hypothetical protein